MMTEKKIKETLVAIREGMMSREDTEAETAAKIRTHMGSEASN